MREKKGGREKEKGEGLGKEAWRKGRTDNPGGINVRIPSSFMGPPWRHRGAMTVGLYLAYMMKVLGLDYDGA